VLVYPFVATVADFVAKIAASSKDEEVVALVVANATATTLPAL
jgi:hypothetical protein